MPKFTSAGVGGCGLRICALTMIARTFGSSISITIADSQELPSPPEWLLSSGNPLAFAVVPNELPRKIDKPQKDLVNSVRDTIGLDTNI